MTFDEWWINQAESEESDDLDYLNLRQQVILAGWVKKSWNARQPEIDAAKADAAQEVATLKECLRTGVEWNDSYMEVNNLYGKVEWVEWARKLLAAQPGEQS